MAKFRQGWYTPKHPEKYVGDITRIRYMSSWELQMDQFLDNNPNVLQWASEEIAIKYLKPTDNKIHRYYPDYWVKYRNKKGKIVQEIIEVKPAKETRRSRARTRKTKLYEDLTYAINVAKWEAAVKFCDKYGMKFRILTERDIFK